jgi:hypothetical protein
MIVTITLTTAGGDTGPFNLYSDATSYLSAFDTNIAKAALLAGFTTSNVPNGTTVIRVISTGKCTNYIDIPVNAPIQCEEFIFQAGDSKNNVVTYKDCATGVLSTVPLSNGEVAVKCAYSDIFSYPVFTTGSGTIDTNGACGAAKGCTQYLLYAFPGDGGATFRYVPCGDTFSIEVSVTDGATDVICTNPVLIPQLVTGNGSATDTTLGCSTTTTSTSSTTTSTTTTPP